MIRFTLLFLCCSFYTGIYAQLPPDFYDEVYMNGFDFPVGITFDKNGRAYVWEKSGQVVMIDSTRRRLPEPLIDIREEVSNWQDHGLLGFCLDNDFSENGYFYLLYALDRHYYQYFGTPAYHPDSSVLFQPTIGRVTRYTADRATNFTSVVPGSRKILLGESIDNGIPLMYAFHGLGTLIMGADRSLLISSGDATSNISTDIGGDSLETLVTPAIAAGILTPDQDVGSYRAQYLGNYNGKILRIDPDTGDGLATNPFYDSAAPRAPQSRIWAYGFRNPYRIMVRPETGSHYPADGNPGIIFAGDVGNGGWEEINIVERGGQNFGWPITEGLNFNSAFYNTAVPANKMAPNRYYQNGACGNAYFNFREIFKRPGASASEIVPNPCNPAEPLSEEVPFSVESLPAIVWNNARWNIGGKASVAGLDQAGEVRAIALDDPDSPVAGELFSGFSSLAGVFYPEGGPFPEKYHGKYFGPDFSGWIRVFDFNEEQELRSVAPFHSSAAGIIHLTYNAVDGALYYVDVYGAIKRISYGGNAAPVARIEADQYYGPSPLTVQFDGTGSYDDSGAIVDYEWDFGDGITSTAEKPSHVFTAGSSAPQQFTVRLRVSDAEGISRETTVTVSLNNTPPLARITSIRQGDRYPTRETTVLQLSGEVSDAEHEQEELNYEWRVFFHHNDHFHPQPVDFNRTSFLVIDPLGCGQEVYYYRVELTVTDAAGLSAFDQRIIHPYCGEDFVEWSSLKAEISGESIDLAWATVFESEVSEMIAQRSADYFHFENIGTVTPIGNSTTDQGYRFVDPAPHRGNNIYRIKIRQEDAYTYTNLAVVGYPAAPEVRVAPNPAHEFFRVSVREAYSEQMQFELYAVSGARLMQTSWPAKVGSPFEYQVLTADLAPGVYFYRLYNGAQEAAGQLVIR